LEAVAVTAPPTVFATIIFPPEENNAVEPTGILILPDKFRSPLIRKT